MAAPSTLGNEREIRTVGRRACRLAMFVVAYAAAASGMARGAELSPEQKQSVQEKRKLALGRDVFTRNWLPTARNGKGDGLGPLFNERSCAACHKQGGIGGGGPSENNVQIINVGAIPEKDPWAATESLQRVLLFPTLESDKSSLVLHRFGMHSGYVDWRAKRLRFADPGEDDVEYRERVRQLSDAGAGPETKTVLQNSGLLLTAKRVTERPTFVPLTLEERNTTALFGAGLVDQVQLMTISAIAAEQHESIRGRPAMLGGGKFGRFGWKAQNATLLDFNENACAVELGLETARRKEARLPPLPRGPKSSALRTFQEAVGEDVSREEIEAMTAFVASLPAPREVPASHNREETLLGKVVFHQIGCAACHTPNVGAVTGIYSDLLLHRMGGYGSVYYQSTSTQDLAANEPPRADEFRTPPLWGVADSAPYLHDGSAKTLHDAILAHGVQGDGAGKAYRELEVRRRNQLLMFLESLRAPQLARGS